MNQDKLFDSQALNRLLILYLIRRSDRRFSKDLLARMFVDSKLMNYYSFMNCAAELCGDGLLELQEEGGTGYFVLTDKASGLLQSLTDSIPRGLRARVGALLDAAGKDEREKASAFSDYFADGDDFVAECRFESGDQTLLDLKLSAASDDFARKITANWKKNAHEIYMDIVDALLKER